MPQEIRVLQCFECKIFQVDIVKKARKWACKICGVTQTLRKEFFRGSGPNARIKAQQLNMTKGNQEKEDAQYCIELLEDENFDWNELEKEQHSASTIAVASNHESENKNVPVEINEKWGTGQSKRKYPNCTVPNTTKRNKFSKWADFT